MRILLVSEYFPPKIMGGGEVNLQLLARKLAEQKIEVFVLTSKSKWLPENEVKDKVAIYRKLDSGEKPTGIINNLKRSFIMPNSIVKEAIKLHRKHHFDLIHLTGISIIAAKKLKQMKIPLFATIESYPALCPKGDRMYYGKRECKKICSFNQFAFCQLHSSEIGKNKNSWYLKYNPLALFYVYIFYQRLNQGLKYCNLIAISEYVQKILFQHKQSSIVIPNLIDLDLFGKIENKDVNRSKKQRLPKHKLKIVYLGSLTKYKGPQVVLKAIVGTNYRGDLYGDGPLKEELVQFIKKNRIDAEIHIQVPYEQVPEIYANADVVVFPSLWPEPFGRIAIEAIASGKPVIGSDIGGIKEILKKRKQWLVKPADYLGIKKNIKSGEWKKITKTELKEYSPEGVIPKIINDYKSKIPGVKNV